MDNTHVWLTIAVMALVTAALRFLPFLIWSGKRKTPALIERLGQVLPCAIMGMLVVFCLKDTRFGTPSGFVPALAGCAVVTVTYLWKRNTIFSVVAGTVCCMLLMQLVF